MFKKVLAVLLAVLLFAGCVPKEPSQTEEPKTLPYYETLAIDSEDSYGAVVGIPVLAEEIRPSGARYIQEMLFPDIPLSEIEDNLTIVDLGGEEPYLIVPKTVDALVTVTEIAMNEAGEIAPTENIHNHNGMVLLYCNPSDLWSNAEITVMLAEDEKTTFSPYYSLRDGALVVGEHIVPLTPDRGGELPE